MSLIGAIKMTTHLVAQCCSQKGRGQHKDLEGRTAVDRDTAGLWVHLGTDNLFFPLLFVYCSASYQREHCKQSLSGLFDPLSQFLLGTSLPGWSCVAPEDLPPRPQSPQFSKVMCPHLGQGLCLRKELLTIWTPKLKTKHQVLLLSVGQRPDVVSESKPRCWEDCILSGLSRGESVSIRFLALDSAAPLSCPDSFL